MKSIAISIILSLVLASPAWALENFSRLRCEAPDVKAAIQKMLGRLEFSDGRSFASEGFSANSITSISTLTAEKNKLVCKLTINLGVRGMSQAIRGKFIIRQFPNGKLTAEWSPFS